MRIVDAPAFLACTCIPWFNIGPFGVNSRGVDSHECVSAFYVAFNEERASQRASQASQRPAAAIVPEPTDY